MTVYYFNTNPNKFGITTEFKKELFGHKIYKEPNLLFLTPIQIEKKSLCPQNIIGLKEKYKLKTIVMFDRIVGVEKNLLVSDHINRSGVSFIVGETPYKNLPMFSDMSGVYITKSNERGCTVHTLGPQRFKNPPQNEKEVVFSETAAIIATLWHYVGVNIRCFGVYSEKNTNIITPKNLMSL
tara:strand:- start:741 stop:1286 length:546 start_codon:yes stop_codon:yes gene_type:complete